MAVYFSSLNSGSNANCYYIGDDHEGILVDAGLSCRETERRMQRLGLAMQNLKAVFISHEHSDHITGIQTLSKKYQLPVYITEKTFNNSNLLIDQQLIRHFKKDETVVVGGMRVTCFGKSHDAADPHSFMINAQSVNISVITDIGYPCKQVLRYFKQSHVAFLESNYCEEMLENGGYPYYLKKRISGDEGHLSNQQALALFLQHRPQQLSHLILSHLSKNNNKPELVDALFRPHAGNTTIVVASRYEESALFSLEGVQVAERKSLRPARKRLNSESQLSLF